MENGITLGKLIGLLLLFCLPLFLLLSINIHTKNTINEFTRHVMGTIFLVNTIKQNGGIEYHVKWGSPPTAGY